MLGWAVPCPTLPCPMSQRITAPSLLCPLFSASVQPEGGPDGDSGAGEEKPGHVLLSWCLGCCLQQRLPLPWTQLLLQDLLWSQLLPGRPRSFCPLSSRQWQQRLALNDLKDASLSHFRPLCSVISPVTNPLY